MDKKQKEIAEKVLNMLEGQKFADWYNSGHFDAYISGDLVAPSKNDILLTIVQMLHL
jgi:hypothetical protein